MKRTAVFILIIIMSFIVYSSNNFISIADAFNQSELNFLQSNVNGWVKLNEVLKTEEELRDEAEKISDFIGINVKDTQIELDNNNKKVIIIGEYNNQIVLIVLETVENAVSKKYETAAVIDITNSHNCSQISNMKTIVSECLKNYNPDPSVKISITGYIKGKVQKETRNNIINGIFKSLKAKKIEAIDDENLISISGYCSNISDYIVVNRKKINLNAASRYSTFDDRTYFWIGTPVINMEY